MPEDFNSLYERLVVHRTPKKKRVKRIATVEEQKTTHKSEKPQEEDEILPKQSTPVSNADKRRAQQERDALVSKVVPRLRLARNLRGFARLSNASPQSLALRICASSGQERQSFVEQYKGVRRKRQLLSGKDRMFEVERRTRLESIAARLYLKRRGAFRHEATTAVTNGKHRAVDELLFFSPPNTQLQSQIGYVQVSNVVALLPQF